MVEFLESDFTSPTWLRLKEHYEARLAALRIKNDGRLSLEDTARARGQIFEVKQILALPNPNAAPPEPNDV